MPEQARWRVLLLDTKRSNPNHYICLSIEQALRDAPEVAQVHRANLGNALELAVRHRCNLFLAFDGEELHPGICERLRAVCGLAVLWVTEDPYELPVNLRHASLFDLVYTNDSASIAAYGGCARHLPLAGHPRFQHHPVLEDARCRYDLFFGGTAWPNRVELLRELMGGVAGLRTKLAVSTNPHLPPFDLGLARSAWSWRTPNSQFARFANVSRVVLTLHRDFSTTAGASSAAATPGPRLFEVALAGGFQLVDGSLPEVANYFEPGRELAVFHGAADALDQLQHYLAHPTERMAMAAAAQVRALAQHTYSARVERILTDVQSIATRAAPSTLSEGRPRILMVTHNVIGQPPWGGVEVYQDWVRRTLAGDYDIWTYAPVNGSRGAVCVLLDEQLQEVERHAFPTETHEALLSCPQRELAFSSVLQKHAIAAVHFQHLIAHVPSLPLVCRALGVPSMWSLHDYYGLCTEFNLIGADGRYCGVERQTETSCDLCLGRSREANPGSQARRRAFWRTALEAATLLHANTEGVRQRHEAVYGSLRRHPGWQVMGVPIGPSQLPPRTDSTVPGSLLRVAIPGNFTRQKGAELLGEVIRVLRDESIEFTILGRVEPAWAQRLERTGNKKLRILGDYRPEDAERLLREADVSVHASIWPETYCLTLSEALRAGLVPVVAGIGALGERVRHGENGLVFDPAAPDQLIHLLLQLARDPALVKQLRRGRRPDDYVDDTTHRDWLRGAYAQLIALSPRVTTRDDPACALTLADCGLFLNSPIWLERPAGPAPELTPPPFIPSIPVRLVRYIGRNGVRATVRRAAAEFAARTGLGR